MPLSVRCILISVILKCDQTHAFESIKRSLRIPSFKKIRKKLHLALFNILQRLEPFLGPLLDGLNSVRSRETQR